jgi:meso-butanediol dehydrogenase/(S,S)-butanediol dehydrogenase/diacetyl reductase
MTGGYGLDGKVAIVTGSGRHAGLGAAMAARLGAEGCRVVVCDLGQVEGELFPEHGVGTTAEMEEVASGIRSAGAEAITYACDVRDERQVEGLVARAVEEFGGVDVLVNNAGVGYLMQLVTEMDAEKWDAVLDVNLKGMFLCTKHAARRMIAQGRGGRIVNISSQGGKSGFPYASAYVASKHGVIGFTRSVAIELGPHAITCNAICPNHVTTGLGAWQNDFFSDVLGMTREQYLEAMRARIPLGRPGLAQDVANACAFLASGEAAYITGEAMNVSGGEETH